MGPETNSPGTLELLSPLNLHYGGNFSRMILPDSMGTYQTDYLAASQAIAILENRAGTIPEGATNKKRIKPDAPFFLAVGFVRPHVPLIATESCFAPYPVNEVLLPPVKVADNVPEEALRRQNQKRYGMDLLQQQKTISAYMASVRYMDQQVGRLMEALDRLSLREQTIVIFLSDHGYNLGEHGCWAKQSLWEGTVRVPLIISVPALEKNHGTRCNAVTELIDLYPTLASLCGYADQAPSNLQGRSLLDHLTAPQRTDNEAVAYTVSYAGTAGSLLYRHWRYTRWQEDPEAGKEELYDHRTDPEEWVNLATDPDQQAILEEMRQRYDAARQKSKQHLH
jgi:arylsulfatase A-like enzyme